MKRLILMRHAKSSWNSEAGTDHARPLNDRGIRQAPTVAQKILQEGWRPELVLASDSVRTQQTWSSVDQVFGAPAVEVRFEPSLYLGGLHELAALLETASDELRTVMALGHNPGWEDAAARLSDAEPELRTSCAALLQSRDGRSWRDLMTEGAFRWVKTVVPDE